MFGRNYVLKPLPPEQLRKKVFEGMIEVQDLTRLGEVLHHGIPDPTGPIAKQNHPDLVLGNAAGCHLKCFADGLAILNLMPAGDMTDTVVGIQQVQPKTLGFLPASLAAFGATGRPGPSWGMGAIGTDRQNR